MSCRSSRPDGKLYFDGMCLMPESNLTCNCDSLCCLQAALDDEMERRRKRVEEWRQRKLAEAQAAEVEAAAQQQAAAAPVKGWSLEDEEDDDEEPQPEQVSPCSMCMLIRLPAVYVSAHVAFAAFNCLYPFGRSSTFCRIQQDLASCCSGSSAQAGGQ